MLSRAEEPQAPDTDVSGGAPSASLAHEVFILLRVPDENAPSGNQGSALNQREEQLAPLDESLHDRVQLDDQPLSVEDGCQHQVDEAYGH